MKLAIVLCALLLVCTDAFADAFPLAVGPYLTLKAGVNAGTIPEGTKTGAAFNGIPDFGGSFFIPFSKTANVGANLNLGYSTYVILSKPNDGATDDNTFVIRYHYFAISPEFVATAFVVGFTFGVPLGATSSNVSGNISRDGSTSDIAFLIDAHLGVSAPVLVTDNGRLNVLFIGSYTLTGMDVIKNGASSTYNPVNASLALGFSYLFNIMK